LKIALLFSNFHSTFGALGVGPFSESSSGAMQAPSVSSICSVVADSVIIVSVPLSESKESLDSVFFEENEEKKDENGYLTFCVVLFVLINSCKLSGGELLESVLAASKDEKGGKGTIGSSWSETSTCFNASNESDDSILLVV
jgi:hypothetical protein